MPPSLEQRRELLARVIGELKQWHFDTEHPPAVRIFIEGDANERASLTAKLTLQAKGVEKNQHMLERFPPRRKSPGDLLTVTSLHATDSRGILDGHLDYDIGDREGRFDLHSSLEIPPLLKAWLGLPPLREIVIGGRQILEAEGDFRMNEHNAPQVHLTGSARCESVMAPRRAFRHRAKPRSHGGMGICSCGMCAWPVPTARPTARP